MKTNFREILEKEKFIAIMRGVPPEKVKETAKALYSGGIRIIEITFNPSESDTIEKVGRSFETVKELFGDEVALAAGTVVKPEYVAAAKEFGAQCIVAPNTDENIIKLTKHSGMLSMPGAFTPSEIVNAYNMGADIVKIFPILPDNIAYLKNILSPLSHIPFITTGGVNVNTIEPLMSLGPCGLAAGASIITPQALLENNYKLIEENAKAHLDAVKRAVAAK